MYDLEHARQPEMYSARSLMLHATSHTEPIGRVFPDRSSPLRLRSPQPASRFLRRRSAQPASADGNGDQLHSYRIDGELDYGLRRLLTNTCSSVAAGDI